MDVAAGPMLEGLAKENALWEELFIKPVAAKRIRAGLTAGAQTREGEYDLEGLLNSL